MWNESSGSCVAQPDAPHPHRPTARGSTAEGTHSPRLTSVNYLGEKQNGGRLLLPHLVATTYCSKGGASISPIPSAASFPFAKQQPFQPHPHGLAVRCLLPSQLRIADLTLNPSPPTSCPPAAAPSPAPPVAAVARPAAMVGQRGAVGPGSPPVSEPSRAAPFGGVSVGQSGCPAAGRCWGCAASCSEGCWAAAAAAQLSPSLTAICSPSSPCFPSRSLPFPSRSLSGRGKGLTVSHIVLFLLQELRCLLPTQSHLLGGSDTAGRAAFSLPLALLHTVLKHSRAHLGV